MNAATQQRLMALATSRAGSADSGRAGDDNKARHERAKTLAADATAGGTGGVVALAVLAATALPPTAGHAMNAAMQRRLMARRVALAMRGANAAGNACAAADSRGTP